MQTLITFLLIGLFHIYGVVLPPKQHNEQRNFQISLFWTQSPKKATQSPQLRSRKGGCERGHWIDEVEGDGKIIKLEDGSLWEVDDLDTITTSLWLPVSDVIVCNGKIINLDDDESANVTAIVLSETTGSDTTKKTSGYSIQLSSNDEVFVINGEVFKSKLYCYGFEKGDRVKFLSGSAFGACASATILNLRTGKTCQVWCE